MTLELRGLELDGELPITALTTTTMQNHPQSAERSDSHAKIAQNKVNFLETLDVSFVSSKKNSVKEQLSKKT